MLILFDHVTPRGIARFLAGHTVTNAKDRGWDTLTNGDLLAQAEQADFDVLLTPTRTLKELPKRCFLRLFASGGLRASGFLSDPWSAASRVRFVSGSPFGTVKAQVVGFNERGGWVASPAVARFARSGWWLVAGGWWLCFGPES
jgi:hypothetical protein